MSPFDHDVYMKLSEAIRLKPIAELNYKTYEGLQEYKVRLGFKRLPALAPASTNNWKEKNVVWKIKLKFLCFITVYDKLFLCKYINFFIFYFTITQIWRLVNYIIFLIL